MIVRKIWIIVKNQQITLIKKCKVWAINIISILSKILHKIKIKVKMRYKIKNNNDKNKISNK